MNPDDPAFRHPHLRAAIVILVFVHLGACLLLAGLVVAIRAALL